MRLTGRRVLTEIARGRRSLWPLWLLPVLGTARAQYHLLQMLIRLNMFAVNQPEVMIRDAAKQSDAQGNLTDEKTKELIGRLLVNLVEWTRRIAPK